MKGKTDIDTEGYFAPCRPVGRSMDVEKLEVPKKVSGAVTRFYIENHTVDRVTLSVRK